jgi:hypothetical protein
VRGVTIALAGALALALVAVAAVLSRAPLAVVGTNSVPAQVDAEIPHGDVRACQRAASLPRGTSAIRVALEVRAVGPSVRLKVLSGANVVTEGEEAAGWGVATSATVPVRPLSRAVRNALVCVAIGPTVEPFRVRGAPLRRGSVHALREIELGMEYLRPAQRSWWSLASSVAYRMGLGRAPSGDSVAWLVAALMLLLTLLVARLALGELTSGGRSVAGRRDAPGRAWRARALLRRAPRAAWMCALVACVNAACWSLITPPFQVPDEESHFAYTQHLVEDRQLPVSLESTFSAEEQAVLVDLDHQEVRGSPETHTISSTEQQHVLQEALDQHLSRRGRGVGGAGNDPPLYYLLQAVPYGLAAPGTLLDQLELMRLFSALMAGLTALFAFLFVRETLPALRWSWTVGGLSVAVTPVLGFMSGADNPDSMLFAVSAASFYCLARAFRRGPTRALGVAIGALMAVGLLTNLNFLGLAPGIALGSIVLTARSARTSGRRPALAFLALALAIGASPVYVYALVNLLSHHPGLGVVSSELHAGGGALLAKLDYIWQLYLPRLPGTSDYFPGLFTTRLWFDRSVGLYGWLDTTFPPWVDTLALVPATLILALCARALTRARAELRRHLGELTVYTVMSVGLMGLIGAGSFVSMSREGLSFVEPRYLAPLLALLAVALSLAARGAGRRWGPVVGALIVVLFLAHDIFSQLLVIGRYYG